MKDPDKVVRLCHCKECRKNLKELRYLYEVHKLKTAREAVRKRKSHGDQYTTK